MSGERRGELAEKVTEVVQKFHGADAAAGELEVMLAQVEADAIAGKGASGPLAG